MPLPSKLPKKKLDLPKDFGSRDHDYIVPEGGYDYDDQIVDKIISTPTPKKTINDEVDDILSDGKIVTQPDEVDDILSGADGEWSAGGEGQWDEPRDRPVEAALQGFGQAGTFGYLPQLQTMSEPVTDRTFGLLTGKKVDEAPWSQSKPGTKEYISARDRNIERDDSLMESNPQSYLGGSLAETALEVPISASTKAAKYGLGAVQKAMRATDVGRHIKHVPKVGKTLAKSGLLKGTIDAGAQGLVYNPGDEKGKVDPLQWDKRAVNANDSAMLGGEFGLGLKGAQKVAGGLSKIPGYLKEKSNNMALRGAGYMLKDRRRIGARREADIADTIYNENLLNVGDDTEKVAQKARAKADDSGQKLDTVYKELDQAKTKVRAGEGPKGVKKKDLRGFHPRKQKEEIEARIRAKIKDDPRQEQAVKEVMTWVDNLGKEYPKGPEASDARRLKKIADDRFQHDKNPLSKTKNARQKAYLETANYIRDKLNQQASGSKKVLKKDSANTLRAENKRMRNLLDIQSTAEDRVLRNKSNHPVGLIPSIVGSGLAGAGGALVGGGANYSEDPDDIIGHIALGGAGALAAMGAKKYGPGLVGRGSRLGSKLSKPIEKPLGKFSRADGSGLIRGGAKVGNVMRKKDAK